MRRDRAAAALALASALAFAATRAEAEQASSSRAPLFGFGRPATAAEIGAWDIDVRPDGAGLPPGRGTVAQGKAVYAAKCAACHGEAGRNGPFDALVGREPRSGFPFGRDPSLVRTIGNYWPYATTLYDYVHRAMPWTQPGSLEPENAVLDAATLPKVVMPARDRFVRDNRRGGPGVR